MTYIIANPSTECTVCHTPNCQYALMTQWDDSNSGNQFEHRSPVCGDFYCVDMLKDVLINRLWDMHGKVGIMFTLASSAALHIHNDDPFE